MPFLPENVLIVGAGFSRNAGLPLASEFTEALLSLRGLKADGPSAHQVAFIQNFVDRCFGEGGRAKATDWPELEDIFTILDISANTGHHLGPDYSASDLRLVRRSIIVRMIRMLSQVYKQHLKSPDDDWHALERLFTEFDTSTTAVLSMNWDTVFEQGVSRTQLIQNIDYGCEARPVVFDRGRLKNRPLKSQVVHILKPHGSVNWLYCDACRETFWTPPDDNEKIAQTLFRARDWAAIPGIDDTDHPTTRNPVCPHCHGKSLGTRFATFSYRKALDFPMHAASWRTAESYLKRSVEWVFFGYSMPAADFEFKHLLKRVQLTELLRPNITVITKGSGGIDTVARFKKFFGEVRGQRTYFINGLDKPAIDHLRKIGVLDQTLSA